jgi:hypothetical protein
VRQAIAIAAEYRAFVGSRRTMSALREKLIAADVNDTAIDVGSAASLKNSARRT